MTCNWSSGYVSDVEYLPGLYVEQAPGHVILTCLLNGIAPPRLGPDFTYCELGCGQGVTALVIAAANPGIQVVATDFNPAHIARARDAAAMAGIDNITFLELSFADMAQGQGLPDFDMVTLHGVWSWIGAADRAHIAAFLSRRLKPGGAVSLSSPVNCRPRTRVALVDDRAPGGLAPTSSARVFQLWQAGHCPAHLVWTAPQDWQA
jgi:SAM-dependent methyltransferase